jgi:hypothetical protein
MNDDVLKNRDVFRRTPKHELVGVVVGDQIPQMISELATIGHESRDVDVLTGEAGLLVLDPHGRHHGLHGRLIRGLQQLGSEEANIITYSNALKHGRAVISVRTPELNDALIAVFARHHATDIVYYGAFSAWTLGDS